MITSRSRRRPRDIPASVREFVNRCLFPYYAQASILAKESQKRFYRAGKFIYALSAAAVGCAALGVLFPRFAWAGFGAELVLLIVMSLTLRQARRKHSHQSWIENRFLTERIRCGTFMAICGVEPRPIEVLPYMGHSQTVNDWTVRVFDEIWDRLPPLAGCSQGECLILNPYVREAWIGDQVDFHKGKQKREGRARRASGHGRQIVLPMTIAAAALHLMLLWLPAGPAEESMHWAASGIGVHRAAVSGNRSVASGHGGPSRASAPGKAQRQHGSATRAVEPADGVGYRSGAV